ncbi:haloacid dehalogenase type II [Metabacillus litoralis]|uniref:haloacid dehalogenase type II n=1 Tax=Metabacillus litoralis TaxID=152268 RepID=UPI00299D6CA3|nr:haloacid dehalogenase type II [Metabacillus litoralis]
MIRIKSHIKVIVFDVYGTLYNVHSVVKKCDELYPGKGKELSELWRRKQLEYSFLRQLMGTYEPFHKITKDALMFSCKALDLPFNEEKTHLLLDAYLHLTLFEEAEQVLSVLKDKQLAVFSNGSLDMLEPLIKESPLKRMDITMISVDEGKVFKPTSMAYQLVLKKLHVSREEVLFVSSNTWDIAGAKNFGFNTAWINREEKVFDHLDVSPDDEYSNLLCLLDEISDPF